MAQAPRPSIAALTRGFAQLSSPQKLGFLVALAALVALIVVTLLWVRAPDYRVLYSNLSDRDGGEVIAALSQLNVPYKVADGGGVLMVPAGQVYDLRLKLAAQGLPKGGAVGFELMDGQKFGISQFAEQVNYQRALAGELARTVQSMAAVQSARVHLAIPRQSVFVRESTQPSASVFVSTYPGRRLDAGQVAAIQHLVASSVPELPAANVTLVDQNGNLLSGFAGDAEGNDRLAPAQLKYRQAVEADYAARIENILTPLLGRENVRAQVTATLDFDRVEETAETYKPNVEPQQATVRSQQTVDTVSSGGRSAQSPAAAGGVGSSRHRENVVNYEVDKTVRHTKGEVGAVKRLSAAVVVNYLRDARQPAGAAPEALGMEELRRISALAREAMGFDQARGDTLNVVNAPFSGAAAVAGVAAPSGWAGLLEGGSIASWVVTLLKYLLAAVVVLAVLLLARSALRGLARTSRAEPSSAPRGQGAPLASAASAATSGASYEADLRAVRELARQEPRVVANVVKDWVSGQ